MSKKILVMAVILSAIGVVVIPKICEKNKSKDKLSTEKVEKKNEEQTESKKQQSDIEEIVEKETEEENNSTSKDEPDVDKEASKPIIKEQGEQKQENPVNNNKENHSHVENSNEKESESSGIVDSSGNNKPIENVVTVEEEPWLKAGVSKEDYFTKPVYSWARIDYDISQCNSLENCESLCMKDAEEIAFTENVSCIQIYSYSGKYLGEMLKKH